MPVSLINLAESFDVNTKKGHFPHKLVIKEQIFNDTLEKPKITDYYENLDEETYNKEMSELLEYKIRIQSELYLKDDLIALSECLVEFNDKIFNNFKINTFWHYTISGLTLNIFRVKYLKDFKLVKLSKSLNNELRKKGYNGGIVDVYYSHGENLFGYDVNSLYPYVMIDEYPNGPYHIITFREYVPFNPEWNGVCLADVLGLF